MTSAQHVVEVRNLSKSYPTGFWRKRVLVLSDLSFAVRRNEIVGFLGPNGAGKTTTIKILNRLAFQDSGSVIIFGEDGGQSTALRRRIGFMPEQPYFYEYLTGEEFLGLCGNLHGMRRERITERSLHLLSRVGLESAGKTPVRKYSKGMMQRLGLAQAILHEPELVILDEPMSGLDPMGRMEVRNLIREMKSDGKTVFFSSHIISDVEALCDRVVMIHRGRKVAEGALDELVGGEVRYVELTFSPAPPAGWLAKAGLGHDEGTVQGNACVVRAKDYEEADRWTERFREAGSRLQSLVPVKKNLEETYVARVSAGAGETGKDG